MQDHYDILGISRASSRDEIKQAYRDLLKVWHPDRFANEEPRLRELAEKNTRKILAAYEALEDSPQHTNNNYNSVDTGQEPNTHFKRGPTGSYRKGAFRHHESFKQRSMRMSRAFKQRCSRAYTRARRTIKTLSWYQIPWFVLSKTLMLLYESVCILISTLATLRLLIPCVVLILYMYTRERPTSFSSASYIPGRIQYLILQVHRVMGVLTQSLGQ